MKRKALFMSILLISLFYGCSEKNDPKDDPKIFLKTIANEDITLERANDGFQYFSNKTLLLNFFTTNCVPCNAQFPHLNNLQEKYINELEIISVLLEEKPSEEIQNFIKDKNISSIVTVDKNNFRLSTALGNITSVPHIVIYDKNGAYVTDYTGAVLEEMIEADLKRIF
ncbi:MAG: TlpA family protein disulfide reductase [Campylobacteraceae bacterium]|jgi:thiol-disulfide isomerase/thioredoxin|nr:TlpA family protein disulfide reductase [Campylobacteraceae bacterium]